MDHVVTVASPDGQLQLKLGQTATGSLRWTLIRDGHEAIRSSAIGIRFEEARFADELTVDDVSAPASTQRSYAIPHGKRRAASANSTDVTVLVSNGTGDQLALDITVFNDGAAHRFRTVTESAWTLVGDDTSFVFDTAGTACIQAYDRVGLHTPASEAVFESLPVGAEFPATGGWSFPALFHAGESWTLLAQTGVDGRNEGSHLMNGIDPGEYVMARPSGNEGEGGQPQDSGAGPWALPWKIAICGAEPSVAIHSDIVALMAPTTTMTDTSWITPGLVSWGWWSNSHSPTNPEALRGFIDLASEMGWPFSLVDANWNTMAHGAIESLVAYAAERNVKLFLWYNSAGMHNVVTEAPRNRMNTRERRREEMAWLRDTGIAGIKVDFFQSDKQSMNALCMEMLEDGAEFNILMNFHGITAPKGWHVTWPHLMTTEAVRGAEQYKFDPRFPAAAARHNTMLAFTRNAIAPMDYTPMTLSDVDYPHLTTTAHELALGVIFESALQHPADKPDAYRALPAGVHDFLRRLPTVWDDVAVLDGSPDSHIVLARRHENSWWLAGINGSDKPRTVPVDISAFSDTPMRVVTDGGSRDDITIERSTSNTLTITMAAHGGFIAWQPLQRSDSRPPSANADVGANRTSF